MLPYKDGVIAYSIPNIWFFRDTNGDGKCDERIKLYGPFDHTRDTHGMQNAFRLGFDGWIYACHGFNNDSHVKGTDGHECICSRATRIAFGPMARTSSTSRMARSIRSAWVSTRWAISLPPIATRADLQLLRGGYYPSFGKPDDGLGFGPPMMEHLHGSTAIGGLAYVRCGDNFSGRISRQRALSAT